MFGVHAQVSFVFWIKTQNQKKRNIVYVFQKFKTSTFQHVNTISPFCEHGSKITPKVSLRAPQMEPKIFQKASKNHLRGTPGAKGYPSRPPRHPPDPKRHPKWLKSNRKCVEKEERPRQLKMQTTKTRDSAPYEDMFFGSIFLGRVPARVHSKTQQQKSGSSPLWMRVCQRHIFRQSTGACALE